VNDEEKKLSGLRERASKVRTKIADPSGAIAEEMYRKNLELARTNHTLSLLRTIDNLVLETENTIQQLANGIAQALVVDSNYLFSGVFVASGQHDALPLKLEGIGLPKEIKTIQINPSVIERVCLYRQDPWLSTPDKTKLIPVNEAGVAQLESLLKEGEPFIYGLSEKLGVKTICFVKLIARNKLVGVLVIGLGLAQPSINVNEIEYLGRIGESTGLALDNKLLFEENKLVLKELQDSNEKLKQLDEAKDEFISMASHQLRTPLTSVKGYISMVLEGDVGRITPQQKEMLDQAFGSAQRMVYLIADLLNVSRLKTGKFVIDSVPTDLSTVVESEVGQLVQTAKARGLTLTYEKPASFPVLQLDETKTRQVIMNFVDNAIYYTPHGGHIQVILTADDQKVEFKVVDDGLGVPKAEQPHLFTKFYRAGNAKKARPDGTGLGLFMAKKVIVSQGGALIFASEEGKGSTFGFTFPRTTATPQNAQNDVKTT